MGLQLTSKMGFENTWYIITGLAALCVFLLFGLRQYLNAKKKQKQQVKQKEEKEILWI